MITHELSDLGQILPALALPLPDEKDLSMPDNPPIPSDYVKLSYKGPIGLNEGDFLFIREKRGNDTFKIAGIVLQRAAHQTGREYLTVLRWIWNDTKKKMVSPVDPESMEINPRPETIEAVDVYRAPNATRWAEELNRWGGVPAGNWAPPPGYEPSCPCIYLGLGVAAILGVLVYSTFFKK